VRGGNLSDETWNPGGEGLAGDRVNELSLFTGAGGGVLGTHHLLGWKTLGYVEYEEYCQKVIRQRIADGLLDAAPIFGDIRKFISDGYAEAYQGMVDVVTAGFPCQPFSVAGKQAGADDPCNMWPQTIECIRIIRPQFAFLENVPGLLASGYFGTVLGDLSAAGYDQRWGVFSSCSHGAPHMRRRLFMVSNAGGMGWNNVSQIHDGTSKETPGQRNARIKANLRTLIDGNVAEKCPNGIRIGNVMADELDRIKAVGNGQDPIVAATAWKILTGRVK
jgi:DNA (cytosine-5)-methyltransferase 1